MVADDDKPAEAEEAMSEEEKAAAAAWEQMAGGEGGGGEDEMGGDGPVSNRVLDQSEIDSLLGISGGGGPGGDKPSGIQAILSSALVSYERKPLISYSLFWRTSTRPSRLSKQPRIAPIPKQARRERLSAEPIAVKLPEHLPRIVETLMPAETCCPCCEGVLFEIGSDESQRLDVVPAQYRVIVTRRPKLACRACHGVVLQHAAPERLIKGGLPTERLVAHVIDAKYHLHLPLYRQAQMLATHGIAIDRSTLAFWVGYAAQELKPLWHRLREILLASAKLCVDETPVPVWIRGAAGPKPATSGRSRVMTGLVPDPTHLAWFTPMHLAVGPSMA